MKKSILASIFAGLFSLSAMAGNGGYTTKIEMQKEDGGPTVVNVDTDGNAHTFEFTQDELKDDDLVANRLAGLDEQTRDSVLQALKGVHLGGDNMLFINKDGEDSDDKKFVIVKQFGAVDGEQNVVIDVDSEHTHGAVDIHQMVKQKVGKHFSFKIGDGMKMHHDSGHAAKVIESLLKSSDLTPDQIDQIQQSLDEKRKD